jgi:tRNA A37 methylthiotransferase MiaB
MFTAVNKFGTGLLYDKIDLANGKIYAECSACMSIYSEFLSWANATPESFTLDPDEAKHIIVLSCQVTDLAILNDFRCLEKLIADHPDKKYYMGGCLAKRFDIELPDGVRRLDNIKTDNTHINDKSIIKYNLPFWVKDYDPTATQLEDGRIFRDMYPLRIGVGCKHKCQYCTIRHTRGDAYQLHPNVTEFLKHQDVVLIADSPTPDQILAWCAIADHFRQPISLRNVEPQVAMECWWSLYKLSNKGLLNILHCPVQSDNQDTLKDMGRDVFATLNFLSNAHQLKRNGVILATNIIINYKRFIEPNMDRLNDIFDYVSWNPYWDGQWDRNNAEKRFKQYLG